jgi:hypothetical protein
MLLSFSRASFKDGDDAHNAPCFEAMTTIFRITRLSGFILDHQGVFFLLLVVLLLGFAHKERQTDKLNECRIIEQLPASSRKRWIVSYHICREASLAKLKRMSLRLRFGIAAAAPPQIGLLEEEEDDDMQKVCKMMHSSPPPLMPIRSS